MGGTKTFGELLTEQMRRAGVGDAEMARTLGVQRQTVFRWREGVTQHPRERQDVLRMAAKLRLTAIERDVLLLAAGFAPESPLALHPWEPSPVPSSETAGLQTPGAAQNHALAERTDPQSLLDAGTLAGDRIVHRRRPRRSRLTGAAVAVVVILALAIFVIGVWQGRIGRTERLRPKPATPGETLIVIGQFANYSGGQAGYNVAGRLQEAVQAQIDQAGLPDVRVAVWPEVIGDQAGALAASQAMSATLVVWGEYDSGRVLAQVQARDPQEELKGQELRRQVGVPSELSLTINTELPQELQWMTLYVLGEAYLRTGRSGPAELALRRALADPPEDRSALARIYYDLGSIESEKPRPDLNQVIAYHSLALEQSPQFASALNNRGVAYLNRRAEGDLQRAEQDFEEAVRLAPELANAQFNLGVTLMAQGPAADEGALAALQRAHDLAPESPGPNNALCWMHALRNEPVTALAFCDQAVAVDTSALSRDSRGIVYAELGRYDEAIAEFTVFLDWLRTRSQAEQMRYGPKREAWIDALRHNRNPFDAQTLETLRSE